MEVMKWRYLLLYGAGNSSVLFVLRRKIFPTLPAVVMQRRRNIALYRRFDIHFKNGIEQYFSKLIVMRSVFLLRCSQITCERQHTFATAICCKRQLFTGSC